MSLALVLFPAVGLASGHGHGGGGYVTTKTSASRGTVQHYHSGATPQFRSAEPNLAIHATGKVVKAPTIRGGGSTGLTAPTPTSSNAHKDWISSLMSQ